MGETVYQCRDCELKFSWSQELCEICLFSDLEKHPPDHTFIYYSIEEDQSTLYDLSQAGHQMFKCGEVGCEEGMYPFSCSLTLKLASVKLPGNNHHLYFLMFYTPRSRHRLWLQLSNF